MHLSLLHTTHPGIVIPQSKSYRKDPVRRLFNDDYPSALGNKQIMATHNTRTHTRTVIYLLSLSQFTFHSHWTMWTISELSQLCHCRTHTSSLYAKPFRTHTHTRSIDRCSYSRNLTGVFFLVLGCLRVLSPHDRIRPRKIPGFFLILKWGLCTKWRTKRLYCYKYAPRQPTQMKRNESDRNTHDNESNIALTVYVSFFVRDSADEHVLSLRNSTVFYFVNYDTAPHIAEHQHRLFSNLDWYISGRVGVYGCLCCATICFQKNL